MKQFSHEHFIHCLENQSALIDIFYIELREKRRLRRERALNNQLLKKMKSQSQSQSQNEKI
jgi:hypothetical protein